MSRSSSARCTLDFSAASCDSRNSVLFSSSFSVFTSAVLKEVVSQNRHHLNQSMQAPNDRPRKSYRRWSGASNDQVGSGRPCEPCRNSAQPASCHQQLLFYFRHLRSTAQGGLGLVGVLVGPIGCLTLPLGLPDIVNSVDQRSNAPKSKACDLHNTAGDTQGLHGLHYWSR